MNTNSPIPRKEPKRHLPSKKEQILELWRSGQKDLWHIAEDLATRPSYVASVLQSAGLINGYYDLYTSSQNPVNIYSEEFRGRMGFKNVGAAQRSVDVIQSVYSRLGEIRDRAGQHHCLVTALTMFNRARYIGKIAEAEVFRKWLIDRLSDSDFQGEDVH